MRTKALNGLRHLHSQFWMLVIILTAFVAGHLILFYVLRHSGISRAAISGTLVSGLVLLLIAKHLGLLAGLFRTLHFLSRRRSRG